MHDEPAFVALGFKSNRRGLPLEHVRVATDTKSAGQGLLTSYRLSMFALQHNPFTEDDETKLELPLEHVRVATLLDVRMGDHANASYRLSMFALQPDTCAVEKGDNHGLPLEHVRVATWMARAGSIHGTLLPLEHVRVATECTLMSPEWARVLPLEHVRVATGVLKKSC